MPDFTALTLPSRRGGRRRDRRGRGARGPLLPPGLPAWRTRGEQFEDAVAAVIELIERARPKQLRGVEFAVEDVPPSDPAPWEQGVALGRAFAADQIAGLPSRIVLYRRAIEGRCASPRDRDELIRAVLVEQVAQLLGEPPEAIDPGYRPE